MAGNSLEDIRWLGDTYLRVSNSWAVYQTTGDEHQLWAATRGICDGLGRLSATPSYWAAVINAAAHVDDDAATLKALLTNLDHFADASAEMLGVALGSTAAGARLAADLANALAIVSGYPTGESIMNLQRVVEGYRDQVCAVASSGHRSSIARLARAVVRGNNVVGGLFVVGVSIATLDATPLGLAGVLSGASMVGAGLL